jgi:hypothetical protein
MNTLNKFWALLVLGVLVVLLPFTGFPPEWRKIAFVIVGSAIVVLTTLLMRAARLSHFTAPLPKSQDHTLAE